MASRCWTGGVLRTPNCRWPCAPRYPAMVRGGPGRRGRCRLRMRCGTREGRWCGGGGGGGRACGKGGCRAGGGGVAAGDAPVEVAPRRAVAGEEDREAAVCSTRVRLHQQEPLNHCRPSVDYLFFSAARMYGAGTLALVMTGMGADGLNGAHAVHESGGGRVGQDQTPPPGRGVPGSVSGGGLAHV